MAIFHPDPVSPPQARRSLTGARWVVVPPVAGGLPGALGQLLATRGYTTALQVDEFLHAELSQLPDPYLLPDMAAAVAAVEETLASGGKIRIFGDYDADGITATALLCRALGGLGGVVDWYIPHRVDDGYGLNSEALDLAHADGVALGITVDNGIMAHEPLAHARELGLKMIVTDHHEPGDTLPPAVAVLNPKRADSVYPSRELAGVGVAFTLLRALCAGRGLPPTVAARFLDLVTVGTVADVVPLVGENRMLVRHGLPMLTPQSKKLGMGALLRAVGITKATSSGDVGFQIGPRLNAAGRIAFAGEALNLLLTKDATEAEALAAQLCAHNAERQEEEKRVLESALAQVALCNLSREKALVLASPDWHPGVIGIVASRIVERFNRPCALISLADGVGKGSARARAPFHLWEALRDCTALLNRFGGHRVAAGFEVDEENIPAFRAQMLAIAADTLTDDDLHPSINVDGWLDLDEVTTPFARQLEELAPFGMGNPTPIFAVADAEVQSTIRRGADGAHLSLTLRTAPGARPINAIWFRQGEQQQHIRQGTHVDVAFTIGLNTWQDVTTAQLVVKDVLV